jgi:drug/metabolite transporter (DMT)-like permease
MSLITLHRGALLGLASAALFGASTPVAKQLLGTAPPLMLAGLLYCGAGVGLLLALAFRRLAGFQPINMPDRRDWPWLAGAIAFGGVAGPAALMFGLERMPASSASLLLNFESVGTALIAWFVFRENFDRRIAVGMLAIVLGGAVLSWAPASGELVSLGAVLIVAACVCWAIDNNLTRRASAGDAMVIACVKGLIAGAVNLALAMAMGNELPAFAPVSLALVTGLFGYGISLTLFVLSLREVGAARAGAYFSVAPFFGAALAIAFPGEPITLTLCIAAALMAAGVWLHVTERHEHTHTHEPLVHAHEHAHDEHHGHSHPGSVAPGVSHSHEHVHEAITHRHPHYPDIHHRHHHRQEP